MSEISALYDENPEGLKAWLETNRLNGFSDLSQAERLLALEYVKTGDRFEAAKAAGIAPNRILRTLRDPLVQEFIKYLNDQRQHYSLIDASFVEVQYLSLYGKLIGEEEVPIVDKDGFVLMRHKFHASESVAALRDIAKMSGVYKEEQSAVNVNIGLGGQTVKLTPEQQAAFDEVLNDRY